MRIVPRMNVLLVQPLAPKTYWGFQYAVGIVGKAAPHPPLGLATLAALLPKHWELRIADLNVASLGEADWRWADAALVTGMLVHKESMHEVIQRARRCGVRTVAVRRSARAPTNSRTPTTCSWARRKGASTRW